MQPTRRITESVRQSVAKIEAEQRMHNANRAIDVKNVQIKINNVKKRKERDKNF